MGSDYAAGDIDAMQNISAESILVFKGKNSSSLFHAGSTSATPSQVQLMDYASNDCSGSAKTDVFSPWQNGVCKSHGTWAQLVSCSDDGTKWTYAQYACANCACSPAWSVQNPTGACVGVFQGDRHVLGCSSEQFRNGVSYSSPVLLSLPSM